MVAFWAGHLSLATSMGMELSLLSQLIESPAWMSPLLLARVNHRSFNLAHGSSMVDLRIDDYALLVVCLGGHFHSFRNLMRCTKTGGENAYDLTSFIGAAEERKLLLHCTALSSKLIVRATCDCEAVLPEPLPPPVSK